MKPPPTNIAHSVRTRLLTYAKAEGEEFNYVLIRYALERFLARLSSSKHGGTFILKGAMLFRMWSARTHRPTKDLDLLGRGAPDPTRLEGLFAEVCAVVIDDGVRVNHEADRTRFKVVTLAVGYGQTAPSLGAALGIQSAHAQEMLDWHRRTFPVCWRWSDAVSSTAHGLRVLRTRLGWPLHVSPWSDNDRSLRNFPVQPTCSDLLHVAAVIAHERRIPVLATLHDAFLIEAPRDAVDGEVCRMRAAMCEASRLLLAGLELTTEVHGPIHFPDRFEVTGTWCEVMHLLGVEP